MSNMITPAGIAGIARIGQPDPIDPSPLLLWAGQTRPGLHHDTRQDHRMATTAKLHQYLHSYALYARSLNQYQMLHVDVVDVKMGL